MPDGSPPPAIPRDEALIAIGAAADALGALRLTMRELSVYGGRRAVAGWRLAVQFADQIRRVDVVVDGQFPYSPPQIFLVDRPPFLTWAHIERDGRICVAPESAAFDPYRPQEVLRALLGDVAGLVEDLVAGRRESDFRDEFMSYWNWSASDTAAPIYSLLRPTGPSRLVRVWRGRGFYLLGESDAELTAWLNAYFGKVRRDKPRFQDALMVWLAQPLTPVEYPKTGLDVAKLINADSAMIATSVNIEPDNGLLVAIGSPTSNSTCFAAVTMYPPKAPPRGGRLRPEILEAGFRPGHTPPELVTRRFFSASKPMRCTVERVDAAWIHGRDQDEHQPLLSASTVTILGCGSVGAAVAVMLAQAGVRRLRIVDYDILKAANIGRHALGADYLGRFKAQALAEYLSERFPHLEIEGVVARWQNLKPEFDLFGRSDLVISAIGDWTAEAALNAAHLLDGRKTPLIYGWTEAHAVAGQAVLVGAQNGCLQCGMTTLGEPILPAARWPGGSQTRQEPACGAVYQPYGPCELSSTVTLVAQLALDALLGVAVAGDHRICVTSARRLMATGGVWSDAFVAETQSQPSGGFTFERHWGARTDCPACRRYAAAA